MLALLSCAAFCWFNWTLVLISGCGGHHNVHHVFLTWININQHRNLPLPCLRRRRLWQAQTQRLATLNPPRARSPRICPCSVLLTHILSALVQSKQINHPVSLSGTFASIDASEGLHVDDKSLFSISLPHFWERGWMCCIAEAPLRDGPSVQMQPQEPGTFSGTMPYISCISTAILRSAKLSKLVTAAFSLLHNDVVYLVCFVVLFIYSSGKCILLGLSCLSVRSTWRRPLWCREPRGCWSRTGPLCPALQVSRSPAESTWTKLSFQILRWKQQPTLC